MCSSVNNLNVKVEQGIVAGALEHLPNGNIMFVFKGIPYAETPERFMPPKKLQKFQVPVLDCTSERNICFQKNTFGEGFIGSEDCLFLNVYTPKMGSPEKLPVMIFMYDRISMKYIYSNFFFAKPVFTKRKFRNLIL